MSSTEVAAAISKLQTLSEARANKVFSLIEDLADLEALENAEDLKDAREALAEIKAEAASSDDKGATIPYDQLRRELRLDR